ncbi:enoyl-CoA hydratase [Sphingomonas spermidinifaciens]|uniref:Enoyl-CoA hydratase n=1 Tax=Sphingomonas spermidinifaciens TaxID=1141889 RepID=A0A2A4B6G9_9SPHN|nr:enoyl-CoA hydratase-related protein [Sphingomonas spermidinifaciens]PCD03525.1 enoyl-CoA hydratase [Sphingomonas spermidinifaciens]
MFFLDTPEPGIARLTIDAPERRNAIPVAEWDRLASILAAMPAATRVLLIGGEQNFSAGADLREFAGFVDDPSAAAAFRPAMRRGIEALATVSVPVVAVVVGGCYGAGVALALAADLRVAGEGARLAVTPARLGIGYPAADVARLTAQVGRGRAARLLFTGEVLDAPAAAAIGLFDAVATDPWDEAFVLARTIAGNSMASTRMLKAVLNDPTADHDAAFDRLFAGDDVVEGLAAYRERRSPRFA